MIKDKITPKLKERFKVAIKKIIETGKEQGFYICKDKEGKFFADKECEGEKCDIMIGSPQDACLGEINQGDFHTHPYKSLTVPEKMFLIKKYGYESIEKELENIIIKEFKEIYEKEGLKNVSINTPSYTDTLKTLGFKCDNLTQDTICIANNSNVLSTDIEKNKVECWTVRETDKDTTHRNCNKMEEEWKYATRLGGDMPVRKWIVKSFDKEIIHLKNH